MAPSYTFESFVGGTSADMVRVPWKAMFSANYVFFALTNSRRPPFFSLGIFHPPPTGSSHTPTLFSDSHA